MILDSFTAHVQSLIIFLDIIYLILRCSGVCCWLFDGFLGNVGLSIVCFYFASKCWKLIVFATLLLLIWRNNMGCAAREARVARSAPYDAQAGRALRAAHTVKSCLPNLQLLPHT